jgi:hypothetical protein
MGSSVTIVNWSLGRDSNPRPTAFLFSSYKAAAPTELSYRGVEAFPTSCRGVIFLFKLYVDYGLITFDLGLWLSLMSWKRLNRGGNQPTKGVIDWRGCGGVAAS